MNKKFYIMIIFLLIITNVFSLYMVKRYKNKLDEQKSEVYKYYTLNGQNENWIVEDCRLLLTSDKSKVGEGIFKYKGNINDIKNANFYDVNLVKVSKIDSSDTEVLCSKSVSSNRSGVFSEDNINTIGSIAGAIYDINKYDIESKYDIYFMISYDIPGRQTLKEKIKLNANEIDLNFLIKND